MTEMTFFWNRTGIWIKKYSLPIYICIS